MNPRIYSFMEGASPFNVKAFHRNTFQRFLRSIGSDPARLERSKIWPEVRAFNSVLSTACVLDELEVGIGCMGVIEQAFAGISASIGQAVVQRGWVRPERLVHYRLHAKIDERHAEEFFAAIGTRWHDRKRRYYVEQGLDLGAYIFNRLYVDLHRRALESRDSSRRQAPASVRSRVRPTASTR